MDAHNARRGGREQDIEAYIQENSDGSTTQLRNELDPWFRSEEITRFQIASHVSRLAGGSRGNNTPE
jgi:hypothetical protein